MYRQKSHQRIFSHLNNLKKTQRQTIDAGKKLELHSRIQTLKTLITIISE